METRELPAGTVVQVFGIPVVLTRAAHVATNPDNWTIIDSSQAIIEGLRHAVSSTKAVNAE